MTDDQQTCLAGGYIWSDAPGASQHEIGHPRVITDRVAVKNGLTHSLRAVPGELKLARNDASGEISFTDKVRYDVHFVAFHHIKNFAQTRFFLPECAVHFSESAPANDLVGMLIGRSA